MGYGRFDSAKYRSFTSSAGYASKSTAEIFEAKEMKNLLDPKGVVFREARDSKENPNSTPIIIALDVTGSMGMIADSIAREGLAKLFEEIFAKDPVQDPQVMFMGIGDVKWDNAPLQVSQFEADNRIASQLTSIWLEHGGGNNASESYNLPWYFAAKHTVHDSWEKRKKKGYLFTVGDELAPSDLRKTEIQEVMDGTAQFETGWPPDLGAYIPNSLLVKEVSKTYEVFHVIIEQGSYAKSNQARTRDSWNAMLGQRVISLFDYNKLPEVVVAAIQASEGIDPADAAMSALVKDLPRRKMAID